MHESGGGVGWGGGGGVGGGGGGGVVFFFNDTATTEIYTLSLHDALPICRTRVWAIAALIALAAAFILRLIGGTDPFMAYRALLILAVASIVMSSQSKLGPVIAAACAWGIGVKIGRAHV